MPDHPGIGNPCNGCGVCCRAVVCAAGSYTMGLVKNYGDRAPGPCPAMVDNDDGSIGCGMVKRPRDYAPGKGSAHDLRNAVKVLIGAGFGCDEVGDPPEADADRKIAALQERFMTSVDVEKIERAVKTWYGV